MSQSAGHEATYYHYGVPGQVDSVYGKGTVAEHRTLNACGRPTEIRYGSDPSNKYQYAYDPATQRVNYTNDPGFHTANYYDSVFGNLRRSVLPGNRISDVTFDGYGWPLVVSPAGALPTQTVNDMMNRAVASFDTLSTAGDTIGVTPTRYSYDALYLTSVKDALGQVYVTDHDAVGRVLRSYDVNSATVYTSYRYDAGGRTTSTTNRRGQRVDMRYDAIGRMVSKHGDNTSTDSLSYSADGNHVTAMNANATIATAVVPLSFNQNTMLDTTTMTLNGQQFVVVHEAPGMLSLPATTTISSSTNVGFPTRSFGRDTTGVLKSITISGTQIGAGMTNFQYNPDMLRTGTAWPGWIVRAEHYTGLHERDSSAFNGFENLHFGAAYSYDTLGRVAGMHQSSPPASAPDVFYSYDNLGRLSGVSGPPAGAVCGAGDPNYGASPGCSFSQGAASVTPETYAYDAVGNRTDAGGRSDPGNRLRHLGVFDLDYDADGNLVRKYSSVTGETQTFTWSAENRLTDVVNGSLSVHYDYDALGHPVRKYRSGVVDRYWLWDGDQWLAEFDANMNRVADYAYYPGIDQPFAVTFGQTGATSTRYFDQDELGNVQGHFNSTATRFGITQRNTYSTWGTPTINIDASSRVLWKGLMWEGDIVGMYFVRNRWYDPDVGRFVSEDPIGLAGGVNQYAFAGNDPVNGSDPSGLDDCTAEHPCPIGPVTVTADGPGDNSGYGSYISDRGGSYNGLGGPGGGGDGGLSQAQVQEVIKGVAHRVKPLNQFMNCVYKGGEAAVSVVGDVEGYKLLRGIFSTINVVTLRGLVTTTAVQIGRTRATTTMGVLTMSVSTRTVADATATSAFNSAYRQGAAQTAALNIADRDNSGWSYIPVVSSGLSVISAGRACAPETSP